MRARAWLVAGAIALAITSLVVQPADALAGVGVRATLDGRLITLKAAGGYSCHDFAYPMITCFRTAAEMERSARSIANLQALASDVSALTTGYIVVFEHAGYAGAAQALSTNYSYLGTIGWNDKISSLKSYGASGKFYEHSPSGGLIYYFGPTTQVSYVGDLYNDKFSSLYFT